MSNSSIYPLDRLLSDATTSGQSGPGNVTQQASPLLEPYHQIVKYHIQDTLLVEVLPLNS